MKTKKAISQKVLASYTRIKKEFAALDYDDIEAVDAYLDKKFGIEMDLVALQKEAGKLGVSYGDFMYALLTSVMYVTCHKKPTSSLRGRDEYIRDWIEQLFRAKLKDLIQKVQKA